MNPHYPFRYYKGVRFVAPHNPAPATFARCGACGRAWDDDKPTGLTPAPAGRCPFEHWHKAEHGEQRPAMSPLRPKGSRPPALARPSAPDWSGSPCPLAPDHWWQDDNTSERVNATTDERRPYTAAELRRLENPPESWEGPCGCCGKYLSIRHPAG